MNVLCVTGYFSSGSSAVLDFLSEFNNVSFINGREQYEHSLFYIGNGLFELYDRLYSDRSNYLSRSHALNDFVDLTLNQYENDYGWFGSYKKYLGEDFKKISLNFIDSISKSQGMAVDLSDYHGVRFSLAKGLLQVGAHLLVGYKISKFGRLYIKTKRPFRYLTCSADEFMSQSQNYLNQYARICNFEQKEHVVFDHLVTAEQTFGVASFLPKNYKIIIVDRNPIDIYLLSKYVWDTPKHYYHPPVPLNPEDFCNNYLFQRRRINEIKQMKNVLYLRFEDFVCDYERVSEQIIDFCELDKENHINKFKYFDPKISINNIGLGSIYKDEGANIQMILSKIPGDLYSYVDNKFSDEKKLF